MDLHSIGPAYAWQQGGRWYFTPFKTLAPPEAIEVERIPDRGQIVLSVYDGQQGRFIRGGAGGGEGVDVSHGCMHNRNE